MAPPPSAALLVIRQRVSGAVPEAFQRPPPPPKAPALLPEKVQSVSVNVPEFLTPPPDEFGGASPLAMPRRDRPTVPLTSKIRNRFPGSHRTVSLSAPGPTTSMSPKLGNA